MIRTSKPGSQGPPETILVVDDNDLVLRVVVTILEAAAFHVLSAASGAGAITLAGETSGAIDLLLSDVDMPGMSGPDLGEILKRSRPDIHVMLMSGGDNGNLLVLNYGWAFIQKPFVGAKLVEMVNDVLNSPNRSQLGGQEFDSRKDRL
jgi:DNA-binding NtrC family response regulator